MKKNHIDLRFQMNRADKIERNRIKRRRKKYIPRRSVKFLLQHNRRESKNYISFRLHKVLQLKNFCRGDRHYRNDFKKNVIIIPKVFCLTRNPDETIDTLQSLNYILTKTKTEELYFDYSQCSFLGLGASVITDAIVLSGEKERSRRASPIVFTGSYPKTSEALQVFLVSGLVKHLGVEDISEIEIPQVERLDPFMRSFDPNELTNKVIDYYNRCLKRNKCQLSELGINYLNGLAGEIIDNLKNHSGDYGTWYVSGHFNQDANRSLGKGTLVFISVGNTIYESLRATASKATVAKLRRYTNKQYGAIVGDRDEERAWTTLSLQYRISRLNTIEHPDRGTGTIKFIESFTELGRTYNDEKPLMSIVSGGVRILFDGTYRIQKQNIGDKDVPVIAFNVDNDLSKRPDSKAVGLLRNRFPGVIISVEFYVDEKYLKDTGQGDEKTN